jgi:hypothetical protein
MEMAKTAVDSNCPCAEKLFLISKEILDQYRSAAFIQRIVLKYYTLEIYL